jgi:hypothetical protein
MNQLRSTDDVIDALGGTNAVAGLTGRGAPGVSNWRVRGYFPPRTYLAMTQALMAKGLVAPAWLWEQEPRPLDAPRKTRASEVA